MKLDDIALVVMSCDAYDDVAEHFFNLKDKYMPWWKGKCYYINDIKNFQREGVITINGGNNVSWSKRLVKALTQIPEKYILYMQEDYLIGKPVEKQNFVEAVNYINSNNVWYYKIDNLPKIKKMVDDVHSKIPSNIRYGINLLTAIIEKDKFLKILPKNDSTAWQVESGFLKNVTDSYEYDLDGCILNTKPIIDVHYGVRHGKWMRSVVKYFKHRGYIIKTETRKTMPILEQMDLSIRDSISHRLNTKQLRRLKKVLIKFGFRFISDNK